MCFLLVFKQKNKLCLNVRRTKKMDDDYGSDNDQYFEDDLYREQDDRQLEPWVLNEVGIPSVAAASQQRQQQGHLPDADELYKDHISHMFDVPSKIFHPPDVEMDYGDAAVQPSDTTGAEEQLMQFPESRMRTFALLGDTLEEKIANTIPSPRRGVRISPDNLMRVMNNGDTSSQLTILDARSQEEFESLAIVGSHNLVTYWDVEHVISVLWRQMGLSMVPRFPNMPIVIVGERSTLRSPGLYRTISMLSQLMYFFKNHVTLDYPEIYILEGGMQALAANPDRYRPILRGTQLLSQFSAEVNIARFVVEKLRYYETWKTPRIHDSHLPVKTIRNPLEPSATMLQTFARYTEEVDPFVKAAQRQRINTMLQ